jgi:hypothetical protein
MSPGERTAGGPRLGPCLFGVSFAVAAAGVCFGLLRALDAGEIAYREVGLDVVRTLQERLPPLEASARTPGLHRIAYVGDSMIVSYPEGRTVIARLEEAVKRRVGDRPAIEVHDLALPGLGPFDYYFISEPIRLARPDQVVVHLNLTSFSKGWRDTFNRRDLSGWIPPRRLLEALRLPLHWTGLTCDQILINVALAQLGAFEPWHLAKREQARVVNGKNELATALGAASGIETERSFAVERFNHLDSLMRIDGARRLSWRGLINRYGTVLDGIEDDNPTLRVFEAAVRVFTEAGIPTLVYVNPINIEHARKLGPLDEPALRRSLDAIERASRRSGARFVDLPALLPDRAFRDRAGHFTVKGDAPDGPRMLAEALAPLVATEARRARTAAD